MENEFNVNYNVPEILVKEAVSIKQEKYPDGFIVMSANLACGVYDSPDFVSPGLPTWSGDKQPYSIGTMLNVPVYCDPHLQWTDTNVYIVDGIDSSKYNVLETIENKSGIKKFV